MQEKQRKHKERLYFSGLTREFSFGAHLDEEGVQFSIFSRHAHHVHLLLFDQPDSDSPSAEIQLDPRQNRTGDIWHIWVPGIRDGQLYLWRMDRRPEPPGKKSAANWEHRYDPEILLIDPCAKAITGSTVWHTENPKPIRYKDGKGAEQMPKCVVCSDMFNWENDRPLNRPLADTIIYECHVRGLTAANNATIKHPGTYAGVVEMIPYFKDLGVTALEFLPVHEFHAFQHERFNPFTGEPLYNYWGYNTVGFFAPNGRYAASGNRGQQVREFKQMVKELHKAGIEVILDIVFNHTAEGDKEGPTFSLKGIDNSIYYMLNPETKDYLDYTGCGNTLNCNHPVVKDFILSCLHYWVLQMHVDGFRFDLASVLGRDEKGDLLPNPPLLRRIEEDPVLRDTKIIAEAWDAAGAYQVGKFTGRWGEWNGKYRDEIRRYWRGNAGTIANFATRIAGSSDLFGSDGRTPHHSINFAFSHDGFTLNDWTSYNEKHNLENGHNNQDGDNWNFSFNHGTEGETQSPKIKTLRLRQAKNLIASLMLSLGVPMMLGGDEFLRTQKGNNNPYCQDNDISWIDWSLVTKNAEMLRFTKEIIQLRKRLPVLKKQSFYTGATGIKDQNPDISWFGAHNQPPQWHGEDLALAALVDGQSAIIPETDIPCPSGMVHDLFMMFNGNPNPRVFHIPPAPNDAHWKIAVDTQNPEPMDIFPHGKEPPLPPKKKTFRLKGRSLAVLIGSTHI